MKHFPPSQLINGRSRTQILDSLQRPCIVLYYTVLSPRECKRLQGKGEKRSKGIPVRRAWLGAQAKRKTRSGWVGHSAEKEQETDSAMTK